MSPLPSKIPSTNGQSKTSKSEVSMSLRTSTSLICPHFKTSLNFFKERDISFFTNCTSFGLDSIEEKELFLFHSNIRVSILDKGSILPLSSSRS